MKKTIALLIICLCCNVRLCFAQEHQLDSIKQQLAVAQEDTNKLKLLVQLIENINEDEIWTKYNDMLGPLSQKLMLHKNTLVARRGKNHYADYLNNKGYLCNNLGDIPEALEYFHKSLKIQEEIGDKAGVAYSLNNIGYIYSGQGDIIRGLDYYQRSLKLREEINDKEGIAQSLSNIGNIYEKQGDQSKALRYYFKALRIREAIGDEYGQAYSFQIIGAVFQKDGNTADALNYYLKSLAIRKKIGDQQGIAYSLRELGAFYFKQKNISLAKEYALQALKESQKIGYPDNIGSAANLLQDIYQSEKTYDKAYEMLKLFMVMKDSVSNDENKKMATRKQFQYEFEKKELKSKAEQEKKDIEYELRSKQQRMIIYFVIAGLIFLSVFGILTYKRYKITQRQNKIIERQKHIVEEHQKEILDSINYAKRIQYALLAHEDLLKKQLPSHFVLFKPKDIVSGDFYWATEHNDKFYLAVCDSTGHGVPGAFMSLLNIGFLSEAIKEKDITEPHKIFNYVRKRLIESITNEQQQDGMDGVLACFDPSLNAFTYAAAHNAPVLIRDGVLVELPKDKMPVGKGEGLESFNLQTVSLKKGDSVFLYTDGYSDQFGGPKGKKFKYKELHALFLSIHHLPVEEQVKILDRKFENWKGALEQVDDVLVIGIKI